MTSTRKTNLHVSIKKILTETEKGNMPNLGGNVLFLKCVSGWLQVSQLTTMGGYKSANLKLPIVYLDKTKNISSRNQKDVCLLVG